MIVCSAKAYSVIFFTFWCRRIILICTPVRAWSGDKQKPDGWIKLILSPFCSQLILWSITIRRRREPYLWRPLLLEISPNWDCSSWGRGDGSLHLSARKRHGKGGLRILPLYRINGGSIHLSCGWSSVRLITGENRSFNVNFANIK